MKDVLKVLKKIQIVDITKIKELVQHNLICKKRENQDKNYNKGIHRERVANKMSEKL